MTDLTTRDALIFAAPPEAPEPLGARRPALLVFALAGIHESVARLARIETADLSGPAAVAGTVEVQMERLARDTTFSDCREVGDLACDIDGLARRERGADHPARS